jgi:hypothetical protein
MIVVGQASAAATSVAIPAHLPGDLILVFARGTALAPAKPTAGGTVPNWVTCQSAIANSVGLTSVGFVATATDTTTGVFTSATHIVALVLRPDAGKVLGIGPSSQTNANNTQTIVYPALTLGTTGGTSWGVRCGTRGVAITAVGTAPSGWTNQAIQPAGASALMSVHTRAGLTSNPVADTVTVTSSNSAYRAHTVEVTEQMLPLDVTGDTVTLSDSLALEIGPLPITGLVQWLDATDPATFSYSSGVLVSQWRDKSGGDRHVAHATPAQQPSRSGLRNGQPIVAFDGSRFLYRDADPGYDRSNVTIFIVCGETSHPQDYCGMYIAHIGSGQDHQNGLVLDVGYGSTTHYGATRADVRSNVPSASMPMPFAVYTALYDTALVTGYENGVTAGAAGGSQGGVPAGIALGVRYLAGAYNLTYALRGEIAEVLVYKRTLTTQERLDVESYLKTKWVLPLVTADTVTVSDSLAPLSTTHTLDLADTVSVSDSGPVLAAFVPTVLAGCVGWWDAEALGLAHGAAVSAWPNLAPGGFALSTVSSPAPVMRAGEFGQNGRPVVRFTAGQGAFVSTATGVDRDFTMAFVARIWGTSKQRVMGSYETFGGTDFLLGWHGGDWDMCYMQGWFGPSSGIPSGLTAKLYSADQVTPSNAGRMWSDGTLLRSGTAGNGWKGSIAFNRGYSNQYSDVEFAEVVFYNRQLSDAERQQLEAYLRAKWITPGNALTLGPSDGLADAVTTSDGPPELGFQWAMSFGDTVTVTETLGIEVALSFADGVNVTDDPPIIGAAHFVEPAETVAATDLLGVALGEYIIPCTPDPVVGEFVAGQSIVGTWFACAKKGILGLGAITPALTIRNLAAEPAGLELGGEGALFVGQKPEIPGGGMYLGAYAPGFSLALTPPLGALGMRTRIPLNVGIEPEIYPAGLELGGSTPKFAGREPPVEPAALELGGYLPGFRFSQSLATPPAGLQLGGGIPVQVEEILILPVSPYPIDLLPVIVDPEPATAVAVVAIDLLSSPSVAVTLEDVETVDSDDLNEVECV